MNCATARNRLLTQPDPAAVPDAVAPHFADCPPCRAWHRLLLQVETGVAAAPVPAADGRSRRRLLQVFRNGQSDSGRLKLGSSAGSVVVPSATPAGRNRLARWWPVGLVAAAVMVGTVSLIVLGGKSPDTGQAAQLPPDPFLDKVVAAKIKMSNADSPRTRAVVWSDLAGEIYDQAKTLAHVTPGADMDSLADLYEQAVGNDALVDQARLLNGPEEKAVFDKVIDQLVRAEQGAGEKATNVKPDAVKALERIAAAAKSSKEKLKTLQQGRRT